MIAKVTKISIVLRVSVEKLHTVPAALRSSYELRALCTGYAAGMHIGSHVGADDIADIATAQNLLTERGANAVQTFLTDPQGWKKPPSPHPLADVAAAFHAADVALYFHAPYVINVASTNNRIRIPSRNSLDAQAGAAAALGASGLIVHGGHVTADQDPDVGIDNWRKCFANAAKDGGFGVPILIENTAGGTNAMTKELDRIKYLWDAIGEFRPGFCLDICHAWAAGINLESVVDDVTAITGSINLVHANSSRDDFGSNRDRHANYASGTIPVELIAGVVTAAGCDVIVETPAAGQADDIAYLREQM